MTLQDTHIDWNALAARTRENFHVLSPVLPAQYREDFKAVYAFCRIADDLGDAVPPHIPSPSPESRAHALASLRAFRETLTRAVQRDIDSTDPLASLWHELNRLIDRGAIKPRHLHDLLDAFERDQHQLRYATWDDLLSYCRKSADPVGRMVLGLGGISDNEPEHAELIKHSDRVCTALQLINHIQDVRRDLLERDRVYIPSAETMLTASDLKAMIDNPDDHTQRVQYINAIRPLVTKTRALFDEAEPMHSLLKQSPAHDLAKAIWLFRNAGIALCSAIERTGCTTLYRRPVVSKSKRFVLLLRACVQ